MEKKRKNKDWISELPDCVLGNIVSRLSVKDAVKTGLLSRRWKHIYTHRVHIDIDFINMFNGVEERILYEDQDEFKRQRKELYKRANQMMRLFHGKNITSLKGALFIDVECSSHIDEWIDIAVESGVKKIELLFSPSWNFNGIRTIEEASKNCFPHMLFLVQRTSMLQHLHLQSCVLKAPCGFRGFTCLKVLQLEHVFLAEDFVANLLNLLFICPQLEDLMSKCCNLESNYLKITGPSSLHLMHLKKSRKFLRVLSVLPTLSLLETLTLNSTDRYVMQFPESIAVLKNLKQLSIYICCHSKGFQLFRVLSLLVASPLVQKFVAMLSAKKLDVGRERSENPDECMTLVDHHQLKEFEMHGCVGNPYEIEFIKSVLKMASNLAHMALGPSNTIYTGNGKLCDLYQGGWHDYLSPSFYELCKEEMREKLQNYVTPTVQFVML